MKKLIYISMFMLFSISGSTSIVDTIGEFFKPNCKDVYMTPTINQAKFIEARILQAKEDVCGVAIYSQACAALKKYHARWETCTMERKLEDADWK